VPELARRFLRPREGWLGFALLLVMLLSLAWSVERAEWFPQVDFMVALALTGAIAGALLGLTRLSVVLVLPASALLGTAAVLYYVGAAFYPNLAYGMRLILLRGDALDWTRIVLDGGFAP